MNAKHILKTLNLTVEHALYREDGLWYHHLKKFPGILFDANGYILFETEEEYYTNTYLQHSTALHVIRGISCIPNYTLFSDEQKLKLLTQVSDNNDDAESIVRKKRVVDIILRNKKLVSRIKKLYNNQCQICGLRLIIKNDKFYSEVHHIVPLGAPHKGPDALKNMLCVCPNCHVQLDLGVNRLEKKELKSILHQINDGLIDYYNDNIHVYQSI